MLLLTLMSVYFGARRLWSEGVSEGPLKSGCRFSLSVRSMTRATTYVKRMEPVVDDDSDDDCS